MREQSHFTGVPVRDVSGWLMTYGHPNPVVMKFVDEYLADVVSWQKRATSSASSGSYDEYFTRDSYPIKFAFSSIDKGMQDLNTLFAQVMRDRSAAKNIPASVLVLFGAGCELHQVDYICEYRYYGGNDTPKLKPKQPWCDMITGPDYLQYKDALYQKYVGKSWFTGRTNASSEKSFNRVWAFIVSLRNTMSVLAREPILA